MKRWLQCFSVFLVALIFGCGIAYLMLPELATPRLESLPPDAAQKIDDVRIEIEVPTVDEVGGWPGDEYPFKLKLINVGSHHGDEVPARNNEKWLGLFKNDGNYVLKSVPVKVKSFHDEILDDGNLRAKTGKEVSVSGPQRPLFLVKGPTLPSPSTNIPTLFEGKTWDDIRGPEYADSDLAPDEILTIMTKDFSRSFEIGGENYKLTAKLAKNKSGDRILALTLQSSGITQILHTTPFPGDGDGLGTLYWVGDLDGDAKPDFYMSLFEHYNVGNSVLFLSSKADKDKLVKKVAYFWTTGC
jgi:hypothetical protein